MVIDFWGPLEYGDRHESSSSHRVTDSERIGMVTTGSRSAVYSAHHHREIASTRFLKRV